MGKLKSKKKQYHSNGYTINITWDKVKLKMQQMFGMDLRSIALFRMIMALCVIGDILERMTDLKVMYTDHGVMPRHLVLSRYSSNFFFMIHLANYSWYGAFFLFSLHIGFAFMMLIGYRTRTASFLTWVMTLSLQACNGVVGHGGDVIFRMMLFINIFLPGGDLYSIDTATFSNENQKSLPSDNTQSNHKQYSGYQPLTPEFSNRRYRYLSFATLAILVQLGCMYVSSYFHKSGAEWKNGEATFYAISMDYFGTDFAKFLVQYRGTLRLMTMAVYKWELFGIFFMFIPIFTDKFRLFGAVGFIMLHLGFVSCLRLGLFFFVTAGAQFIYIPPFVWDNLFNWLDKRILKGQRPLKVYYNTTSPLSQYTTLTLKTFFILPNTAEFSPMETMVPDDCISLKPNKPLSISTIDTSSDEDHVDENGKLISKNNSQNTEKSKYFYDEWLITIDEMGVKKTNYIALLKVWSKSPLLFPLAWIYGFTLTYFSNVILGKILDFIHVKTQQYQIRNHKISLYQKKKYPATPSPRIFGLAINVWMAFICWFILAYNCNNFRYFDLGYKHQYYQFAYIFRIDQGWGMFSPSPPKMNWWNVIHGKLQDGTDVELFKKEGIHNFDINTEVNFEKPVPFDRSFGNHRWYKYWENGFNQPGTEPVRLEMGRYICREFNNRHFNEQKLVRFTIYYVYDLLNLDGTRTEKQHLVQWEHVC
ncbi:hypothetical protein DLAC_00987 [Tieghemostelium lacteum]|uniref:HTTM-like domain-containing protein n=1 Tax=Tieghemostelium lacteum TaxID=361077 RepID=A0A152A7F6_TIELA|nr:hypothetical protein DLAC_00987 [Tieghemostelium lacteum]|eukprot:KYR02173.1 hypothetical protein DLAC_00987 [Tieghemostelium lacteum]